MCNQRCTFEMPRGLYKDDTTKSCKECPKQYGCVHCLAPGKCVECVHPLYVFNDTCVLQCPSIGYFANEVGKKCIECHPSCRTCNGASEYSCITCNHNYIEHMGQCLTRCPYGMFKRSIAQIPLSQEELKELEELNHNSTSTNSSRNTNNTSNSIRDYYEYYQCFNCSDKCAVCVEDDPDMCLICASSAKVEYDLDCYDSSPVGYSSYDLEEALPSLTSE
jgi:hypothetical protein